MAHASEREEHAAAMTSESTYIFSAPIYLPCRQYMSSPRQEAGSLHDSGPSICIVLDAVKDLRHEILEAVEGLRTETSLWFWKCHLGGGARGQLTRARGVVIPWVFFFFWWRIYLVSYFYSISFFLLFIVLQWR